MQSKRPLTVTQVVCWIRKHCQVDTGDGIYGDASLYSARQIKAAILRGVRKRKRQS